MGKEGYPYSYGFVEGRLLDEASAEVLSEILATRIRFVHEEYLEVGQCTPFLLDQILLMDTLEALEVDINLNPDRIKIKNLPHVKATRREGRMKKREDDIARQVEIVAEQLRPLIDQDRTTVTLRLFQPHRDGVTNADVYPRITGTLEAISHTGQQLDHSAIVNPLSIPLSMIIQAGPNAVRCILGTRQKE